MTTEVKKELTVTQYEFYKSGGMTDARVMKLHGLDHNQLYKWKKENELVGKDYGLRGGPSVKTYKASDEVKPLKENDIPEERLSDLYNPNKQIQEKLAEKKPATGWERVKELTKAMSEDMKTEMLAAYDKPAVEETVESSSIEETQMNVGKSETFDKAFSEAMESEQFVSYKEQLENLQKEKALQEDKHASEMKEMEKALCESQKQTYYQGLMLKVSDAVKVERDRQNNLYGHQRHDNGKWLAILAEEFGEVAQAMQKGFGWGKESDADDLFKELIHVSAVSKAWAEQVLEEREKAGD